VRLRAAIDTLSNKAIANIPIGTYNTSCRVCAGRNSEQLCH
jgi:hypothetical protein